MPEKTQDQEVTEEQANAALMELANATPEELQEQPVAARPEPSDQEPVEAQPVEAAPADDEVTVTTDDDLESLRQRHEDLQSRLEKEHETFESRLKAQAQRSQQSEQILRQRYLKKSDVVNKALQALRSARSPDGVSEDAVDTLIREIEGTMNPQSPSYSPPPVSEQTNEEHLLVMNQFLNEKQMTDEEANEFGRWVQTDAPRVMPASEQAIAGQSIDGFLRLAHHRWREGIREQEKTTKRDDAVRAVESVQRTQRAAARAAAPATAGPVRTAPADAHKEIDYDSIGKDDVAALLRQSVEQYTQ